jgi:prepilin-type N-terminal cleavage/methylation domain-containing protein
MKKRPAGLKADSVGKKLAAGFTLIEIMISVAILGIGLTLVANSYIVAQRGINATANNIEAFNLLKAKLDELEILSLKEGLLVSQSRETIKGLAKNYNYTQEIIEIAPPKVSAVKAQVAVSGAEDITENFIKVCLDLSWQEQNANKNATLSTYLPKQKEEKK